MLRTPKSKQTVPVPVLSLDSLTKCPKEILATETQLQLPPPRPVANPLRTGDPNKYCDYHQDKGHHTNDFQRSSSKKKKRKDREATESWMNTPISFPPIMTDDASDEPLIIEAEVEGYLVRRVYVDEGSSVEVMFEHCFENLPEKVRAGLRETRTDLVGFAGEVAKPLGKIDLEVRFGNEGLSRRTSMKFIIIRAPSPYNVILGRPGLKILHAIPSTIHSMIKFPTPKGIATLIARTITIAECRLREEKQMIREETPQEEEGVDVTEQIIVNPSFPDQMVTIGGRLSKGCKEQLKTLLKGNMEVFAWEPADMTGVPRKVIEHALNVNPSLDPVCQKRRTFSPEKSGAVTKEVTEWIKAGIVRPVKYPTYISNPVLVKKCDGSWRMCIDFKNLNSACPKDYYPLPNIDCKVEAVMGFKYKCFLDAYKGYHQIQMAKEDEEKTAFYTEQGTYCYTKMPFGLKNAGATYQRLVDSTFQNQIGRNLEAYVDDMVIKSKEETSLLADIAETFEGLKTINMKLNPKKCSFGVEEGKFLGYMVTSEGIRANPKKTKAISDLQSPKTLKEMQSLSGKLASLNRFLAKSAERALPFFNTLKNITKENKHEYRWTPTEAEELFQHMKSLIMSLIADTTFPGRDVIRIPSGPSPTGYPISDAPDGEREDEYFQSSGAGLVLAGPSGVEYAYALRLTFTSTNNEAEYEALLAGLRIARMMNVLWIKVKVDSKLMDQSDKWDV
ncbi:reverse transcriptase domain-containing protein [Tanacetum coccineum]